MAELMDVCSSHQSNSETCSCVDTDDIDKSRVNQPEQVTEKEHSLQQNSHLNCNSVICETKECLASGIVRQENSSVITSERSTLCESVKEQLGIKLEEAVNSGESSNIDKLVHEHNSKFGIRNGCVKQVLPKDGINAATTSSTSNPNITSSSFKHPVMENVNCGSTDFPDGLILACDSGYGTGSTQSLAESRLDCDESVDGESNISHNQEKDTLKCVASFGDTLVNLDNMPKLETLTLSALKYVVYQSESQMPDIMRLITKDLSEPYSIYTYRYFIHNWPKLCFLAMEGDVCVGAIVCKLDMHKNLVRRGYIAMLAVDDRCRRRKIGSHLVMKAIKVMVADNCDEVVLETEITNKPALKLYENLGFVRDKRLFRYYLNGVDALRLKLWLR